MFYLFLTPQSSTPGNHGPLRLSRISPFSEHHKDGLIHYEFDWTLSLSNMHLGFFHVFHWFESHIFLSLRFHGLDVYLSIHLLKEILVASKFWQLWIKLLYIFMCRFCADIHYQLLWVKLLKYKVRVFGIRIHQITFQRDCAILHFYQQWIGFLVVSHSG